MNSIFVQGRKIPQAIDGAPYVIKTRLGLNCAYALRAVCCSSCWSSRCHCCCLFHISKSS